MKTTQYINQLLYTNDCVIVPSLGAFVASYVPASIDVNRGVMLPPRKEIVFNSNLTHNDGLLTDFVACTEGISYSEATRAVNDFAAQAKRRLSDGELVMLAGIGSLRKIGNDIVFKADSNNGFYTDSYGFAPLPVAEVRRLHVSDAFSLRNVRRIAISAAMVLGFLLVSQGVSDSRVNANYTQASIADAFINVPQLPRLEEKKAEAFVVEDTIQAMPALKYHIVVASYNNKRDAEEYVTAMKQQGINDLTLNVTRGRVRVVAASFATQDEAVVHNRAFRKIAGFESAWVFKEK